MRSSLRLIGDGLVDRTGSVSYAGQDRSFGVFEVELRVAAITPLYPPDSLVGAWLATHEFMKALVQRGHSVEAVPFLVHPGRRYEIDGVRVRPVGELPFVMQRSDVIVSHLGDTGSAHRKALSLGKPSVKMVHGGIMDARKLVGSSLVVCNSEATRRALGRWSGPTIVARPPTNPDRYRTTPGDRVTLVNLASTKGGDIFWRLAKAMPDVSFLGVVGGYGDQVIHSAKNVDVIPSTPNMVEDVYSRTRILIMPSTAESWGMTAVEAMCSGIPVIARHTEGLAEALGDAGTFVHSPSTGKWTTAIRGLLEPDKWSEMSLRSIERVKLLDPDGDVELFCRSIEALGAQPSSPPAKLARS